MNYIDIAVIVFIVAVTLISAKKGFIKSLLNLSAYALAGIVAKILASPVAAYIYTNFLKVKVLDELSEILPSGSVSGEIGTVINSALASLPSFVSTLAAQFGITEGMLLNSSVNEMLTVENIEAQYLGPIVSAVVSVIVLVILFILFAIVFRIIFSVVDKFLNSDKHKIIRTSNRVLGAVFGFIKSLVPAGLICALLNIAAPLVNNEAFYDMVTDSFFCKFIAGILN